ncbi:MAG: SAM-dependent methyltransferase [Bacteroidales bacterium]|nr:SAM-dependent methyltransferase [Bacteroidales bacterium]
MTYLEAYITDLTLDFFLENQNSLLDFAEINTLIKKASGINNFFTSQKEATELLNELKTNSSIVSEPDRREYGDFQTNEDLAFQVAKYSFNKCEDIEFVLEPTCGKGNFILASLGKFETLKKVVGVEIYLPYVWKTKFGILKYFLENRNYSNPEIDIIHGNAFEFDYVELAKSTKHLKTLIIGNPPWVTNSELGSINSKNLPIKSNFKKHNGLEAITGKGNFDIGEYISFTMLKCFENHNGLFSFLIKNSVVKNLIQDQKRNRFRLSQLEKLNIDSKTEFNVSVNACLFITYLNKEPDFTCKVFDFYSREYITTFGWYKNKFVNSVEDYDKSSIVDGKSIFTWRSGVKHDCSKIMELERGNGHFVNALGEEINLENNLVYGLLKSSDLKKDKINTYRKLTIITQSKIGQDTTYIKDKFPLTYQYLYAHKDIFKKRKSSIYKEKPDFSIFGIGDYSFTKYKVAISGFYKSTHFTLVSPKDSKPIMLDDTCYFIGFDKLELAEIAHYLLNFDLVQRFLKSIIFSDSKRSINKDILMRIDFEKAFECSDFKSAKARINNLKIEHWEEFGELIKQCVDEQMILF